MDKIITQKMRFVDSKGRTRIFNGMNIDDKQLNNSEFRYNLNEEFFKKYKAYGMDFIRLAVTWQNLEPEMGKFNESYLQSIDRIFELAERYEVYILLDMHQDLYSGNDGQSVGDGAPSWAAITDGNPPKMPKFVWAEGYFWGKWVHKSFDHFWNNDPIDGVGIQDRYAEVWKMLARRYGNCPALFGFDLLNEPFPGSAATKMFAKLISSVAGACLFNRKISRSSLAKALVKRDMAGILDSVSGNAIRDIMVKLDDLSAQFDITKYSPFLNRITAAIREVTPNGIIMMEQSYICNSGVKQSAPPITVNGVREPLQCFGPHAYDMTVDTPLYKYANADRVKAFFTEMHNTQLRLNIPVVVGEWGGCSDNKDTSWFPHAYELLEFFDDMQWGQAYWDYHGDDLDSPLMGLLCRTHPIAVAGMIDKYNYNRETKEFTLDYTAKDKGDTLIYVHAPFTAEEGVKFKTVEKNDNGSSVISFKAENGKNHIKISFKED